MRNAFTGEPNLGLTSEMVDGRNLSKDWARRYLEITIMP